MTFDFDNMDINREKGTDDAFEYTYNGKRYLYKKSKSKNYLYELLAEKIANRLDIPCCHYILTYKDGIADVSSEMFDTTNYISLREVLRDAYGKVTYFGLFDEKRIDGLYKSKNNLEDIWFALEKRYGLRKNGQQIVSDLMNQIVKVFLFDALIGNSDRHTENIGFIDDGVNISLAPIFDNDYMLSDCAVYDNDYSIFVDSDDYFAKVDFIGSINDDEQPNTLKKFFDISASEYKDEMNEMLSIISIETLEEIYDELNSEGVIIPFDKRRIISDNLMLNQRIIKNIISGKKAK